MTRLPISLIIVIIVLLLFSGCSTTKSKGNKTLSDYAAVAVVMKHNMNHIAPEERWRYIGYSISSDLEKLGYNHDQIIRFVQEIVNDGPYPSMEAEVRAARGRYKNINDPNDFM